LVHRLIFSVVGVLAAAALVGALLYYGPLSSPSLAEGFDRPDAGPISASMGRISVNSWPSAAVYVDGKRIPGRTPVLNHELSAGEHTLVFEQATGVRKELVVHVTAGQEKTVVINLEK
jgi:hypothetical protein